MKIDVYRCDRCNAQLEIESGRKPITVEHIDGRFMNEEKETVHLCDDCYLTFLYAISTTKERREAFDKLTEKFSIEDEKEGKVP